MCVYLNACKTIPSHDILSAIGWFNLLYLKLHYLKHVWFAEYNVNNYSNLHDNF